MTSLHERPDRHLPSMNVSAFRLSSLNRTVSSPSLDGDRGEVR
jgi:hypothetical protein